MQNDKRGTMVTRTAAAGAARPGAARTVVTIAALAVAMAGCAPAARSAAQPAAQLARTAVRHPAARTARTTTGTTAVRPHPLTSSPGCGKPPPRHAWAVSVSSTGHIRWQTPLPTHNNDIDPNVAPVVVGGVAVLTQDGVVHGLRLADGRPLWSWHGGQSVYGIWRWRGLVAILTDQVSTHAKLTGLDAATGSVRWVVHLPGNGLYNTQAQTSDGGLAMIRSDRAVEVISLRNGRVRWTGRPGRISAVTAADGLVIAGSGAGGRLSGYNDITGRRSWTRLGLPGQPILQLLGGLVLVTDSIQGPGDTTALIAIKPATGTLAWRFDPGMTVTALAYGPAGLAVATYVPDRRLYLLDARTGRPRWRITTAASLDALPEVTGRNVVAVEGGVEGFPKVRLVSRDSATGGRLWAVPLATGPVGAQPVLPLPGDVVVQTVGDRIPGPSPLLAFRLATGRLAWRANMPAFVQLPPVPIPGGLLIQPSDPAVGCPA
jgi:outer membrane protein assembly factor BamB